MTPDHDEDRNLKSTLHGDSRRTTRPGPLRCGQQ
jgi:hypothetical protein